MTANAANRGQKFSRCFPTVYGGTTTRVRGTLNGKAGKAYSLQFFANPSGDSSGYGEGQGFSGTNKSDIRCVVHIKFSRTYLPASVPVNWMITATATDSTNNTSEFSAWIPGHAGSRTATAIRPHQQCCDFSFPGRTMVEASSCNKPTV